MKKKPFKKFFKKNFKIFIPFIIGILIYLLPSPEAIDPKGWQLFAIFMGCIIGIILKPFPMGVVTLVGLSIATITGTLDLEKQALTSFSSSIIWLIVFVYFIARAFIKSHLGTRVACFFIKFLGKNSLGLSYGIVLTDFLTAPLIPSLAARAGGIIYPIINSMSESLGSHAEKPSSKKIGAFLIQVAFHCGLVTSAMFFTAMAGNPLAQKIAFDTCNVTITWSSWFMGAIVPGLISLILIPLVLYWIYPPEMKHIPDAIGVANKKLHTLGKVKKDEWVMLVTFAGMLLLWINGVNWGIDPATTALAGVTILFLTNILTIDDLLKEHEAWHTLIWYAIIVSMAKYLQEFGFVGWFSGHIGNFFSGYDWPVAFLGLTLVYFYSHYFLASNAAHIGAMYGAFLMSAIAVGTPPLLAALVLGYSSSLFSHMTQYGSASAVVFFGGGYVPVGKWWKLGLIISILNIAIWGGVGSLWWKYLGLL